MNMWGIQLFQDLLWARPLRLVEFHGLAVRRTVIGSAPVVDPLSNLDILHAPSGDQNALKRLGEHSVVCFAVVWPGFIGSLS